MTTDASLVYRKLVLITESVMFSPPIWPIIRNSKLTQRARSTLHTCRANWYMKPFVFASGFSPHCRERRRLVNRAWFLTLYAAWTSWATPMSLPPVRSLVYLWTILHKTYLTDLHWKTVSCARTLPLHSQTPLPNYLFRFSPVAAALCNELLTKILWRHFKIYIYNNNLHLCCITNILHSLYYNSLSRGKTEIGDSREWQALWYCTHRWLLLAGI